ncbi:MAG TPA: glycosyltransferase family 4 protein [Solirubrobacteraceae bacterium]|jgi:glycosyltransferase involved in cell wall biosynthesis|nr:glycosyltransferase family 4 protein [Solirubrobacteraceae bacterium]
MTLAIEAELLAARRRAAAQAAQEAALPSGRVVVTCDAPFGGGGLGRHLQEIVHALERRGSASSYICGSAAVAFDGGAEPGSRADAVRPRSSWRTASLAPLARVSPGWRLWRARVEFDAGCARALPRAAHLIAFNRQALAQFRAARGLGYESVELMAGSPHVRRVARQHARALSQYPLERSFGTLILPRHLAEYARADRIHVACRYTWESFLEHGVPEQRLALFPLTPDPRYRPAGMAAAAEECEVLRRAPAAEGSELARGEAEGDGCEVARREAEGDGCEVARREAGGDRFDVLYIGSLSVAKGVPLLIDAVRCLPFPDLRLLLVGNWKSRGMRRFVEAARLADPRIVVCPGDPLGHLQRARLCVHPSFEDGFAYAPAEALACGVPVLVSEDTGMKELVDPGRTGMVLPTGDRDALSEAIVAAYRGEVLGANG